MSSILVIITQLHISTIFNQTLSIYEGAVLMHIQILDKKIILPCWDLNLGPPWSPVHEADDMPMCNRASINLFFHFFPCRC